MVYLRQIWRCKTGLGSRTVALLREGSALKSTYDSWFPEFSIVQFRRVDMHGLLCGCLENIIERVERFGEVFG